MAEHFDPAEPRDDHGRWTNEQVRKYLAKHPVRSKHIVDMYHQATEGEKATGQDWYRNANKIATAMSKSHGVSVRQAAGVIAAYSPQTPWGRNLVEANEVLRNHKAVGGPGAHLNIDNTPLDAVDETRVGIMASGTNKKRAERVLAGEDFEDVFGGARLKSGALPPHSLKVRSFGELIARGGQDPNSEKTRVVIDRHAAGVARGLRMTENEYAIDAPSSSRKKYQDYANAYRDAAAQLSRELGYPVTPEAVQATTWLTRQRLNNSVRARKALGSRDETETLGYFAQYEPNIAEVIGTPMTGYAELSNTDLAFNPAERRDSHGRWTKGGASLADVMKGHNVRGLGTNPGTPERPINVHGNVMLAAKLIGEGKHVRLNKVDQVGTLLADLLKLTADAKKRDGRFNLCAVSVPKTNLFCAKNKGIDRINMPQLAGVPAPGSKAAALQSRTTANHPGGEVDLTDQFEKELRSHGVKVTDTTLPAASFKATQDQLVGSKVAGIEKFMETAPKDSPVFEPIFVTRDHYIIDGHHRWAAQVALDAKDGVLGNYPMKVRMVDMDIAEALHAANAFAHEWGIAAEGTQHTGPTVAKFAAKKEVKGKALDLAFDPDEPRDPHTGRWVHVAGLSLSGIANHMRGLPEGSKVQINPESGLYTKSRDGSFAPFEPGGSKTPEQMAMLAQGASVLTQTPEGYDPESELLAQIDRLKVAKAQNSMFQDMSDHGEGEARNRISAIANAHPDLLDSAVVQSAIEQANDTGVHRLLTSHNYRKSRSPEQQAKTSAALDASLEARQKKAAEKAALEQLSELVSDFEFDAVIGSGNGDEGDQIKQLLADNPHLIKTPKGRALLKYHPELSGRKPTYKESANDYGWKDMDESGGYPEDADSMHEEHVAQNNAEFWHDAMPPDAPEDDQYARSLWEQYQNPDLYGSINKTLRTGEVDPDMEGPTAEKMRHYVDVMFKEAGTTTKAPMTLYRAIRSSDEPGHDWAENFKVGSTFTDKGIMSCTAHGKFAQGWLALDPHGTETDEEKPNDVVLEIRTPSGQRIVGGSRQFIESMLPPNTTLRILSNEKRTAKTPRNPLGDFGIDPFDYTHVVAEVVK